MTLKNFFSKLILKFNISKFTISILYSYLKQFLINVVFLFNSSSFNLSVLIGFKLRLFSDKHVLKHLPLSLYINQNYLYKEFWHHVYIYHIYAVL